jgi:hypothetical protein
MSLINIFGDGLLDVWNEAFGEVWYGSEVVTVNIPGIEWAVSTERLQWSVDTGRLHWKAENN